MHSGMGGSLTAIAKDLEQIWGYALQNTLEIPVKDLRVCYEFTIGDLQVQCIYKQLCKILTDTKLLV